jgi:membrane protein DedA with SNARE-associated domain
MSLAWVQHIIVDYGFWFYAITFLWTLIEGETFVIYAGVLIAQGFLHGPLLLACAWVGSFLGDQVYFYAGRRFGPLILRRFPNWQPRIDAVEQWLQKHDTVFILSFRWLYGIRNFASLGLGMSNIPWVRFARLNFLAAGIWAAGFIGIGYIAGQLLRPLIDMLAAYFTLVMLGIFAFMFALVFALHRLQAAFENRRRNATGPGRAAADPVD